MEQEEEQKPFIYIELDVEAAGDPKVSSNLPTELAIAYLELAKQKMFAQFYGAVNQKRAQEAVRKPNILIPKMT